MEAYYKFEERGSIFNGLPSRRSNSKHLDRMGVSWKVWRDPEDKITRIKMVWLAPENDLEQKSLDRLFKKIKSQGTLIVLKEDPNINDLNVMRD